MRTNLISGISMFVTLFTLQACQSNAESYTEEAGSVDNLETTALTLLKQNCFTCHNPNLEIENRIAPPMFKIRQHYFDEKTTKEEFVKNITHFVNNPTEENSIMPGAVRNFGIMPKMNFKEEDLKIIAEYLYDTDVASDEWDKTWAKFIATNGSPVAVANYEDLGRNVANETKANLGKNLMAAIKEKGAAGAVEFCNTRAIPITDSMSVVLNTKVKRVSDKPRNPSNQANADELAYIESWKTAKTKGEQVAPLIAERNGKMVGYYPIETNAMCLQCHGTPEKQITPETLSKIKKLYPADKAVGYGENEIRGIFVVEMDKK
jgi:cytochrome c551/c552